MPGLHKLDILDNTTAVCTTSEKELFFELLEKHKTRQEPHWSRMLGEYNRIATDSWGQGQYDIRWKTVPLLELFAKDCECANSVARSNRRLALLQDQSDAAANEFMAHLLQSCLSSHMAQHLIALLLWTSHKRV